MTLNDANALAAILAVPHSSESEARDWFAAVSDAFHSESTGGDDPPAWSDFAAAFQQLATSTYSGTDGASKAATFVAYVESIAGSQAIDVVAALAGRQPRGDLDEVVRTWAEQATQIQPQVSAGAAVEPEDPWVWDDEQQVWLLHEQGQWLPQETFDGEKWLVLNRDRTEWEPRLHWDGERWLTLNADKTGWLPAPGSQPDERQAGEPSVVDDGSSEQAGVPEQPPDGFAWVRPAQRTQLEGLWGDQWPNELQAHLDRTWHPGWETGIDAGLKPRLLDRLLTELEPEPPRGGEPPADAAGEDPLAWVSAEQRQLLADEVYPDGGWQQALTAHLDTRWDDVTDWRTELTDQQKRERLEGLLPTLTLQPAGGLTDEEYDEVSEVIAELLAGGAEKLDQILDSDDTHDLELLIDSGVLEVDTDDSDITEPLPG